MALKAKGIYIGKCKLNDVEYPIAIYSEKDIIDNITKVQVSEISELDKEENRKHLRAEETFIKYLIIAFYEEGINEPVLMIQIEKFDISKLQNTKEKWLEFLKIFIKAASINSTFYSDTIKIYITRTNTGINSTIGILQTDDGRITGYTVELPRGTDYQCKEICNDDLIPFDCYCIQEGTYSFEINTKNYPFGNIKNYSLRIISTVPNGRNGVLIHPGRDDAKGWSQGCILTMPNEPKKNCELYGAGRNNTKDQSIAFTEELIEWVKSRESEIKKKNKNINKIIKQIIITKTF